MLPRRQAHRPVDADEERGVADVRRLLPPALDAVQYVDLEGNARARAPGPGVGVLVTFKIPSVLEHGHESPVHRRRDVLAAQVHVLVSQPRRDLFAGELAGLGVALPRLDAAGVGDGQEAAVVVYGVLDGVGGARHPPRGVRAVLRRREGRGADAPFHDEHGGVAVRARRFREDDLAVEHLPHLGGRDRERPRRWVVVTVSRRRRGWGLASEADLQEGMHVEAEPVAAGFRLDERDGGDGRQVGVRARGRVGHSQGAPVVGRHEPPARGADGDGAAHGHVRGAHGGGLTVGHGKDPGPVRVLRGEDEPRRLPQELPRLAADGGEGEPLEEGEAVVDLGQQLGRKAVEVEQPDRGRCRGSCGGRLLPLPLPLELAAAARTGHDCFDEDPE